MSSRYVCDNDISTLKLPAIAPSQIRQTRLVWLDPASGLCVKHGQGSDNSTLTILTQGEYLIAVTEAGEILPVSSGSASVSDLELFISEQVVPRVLSDQGSFVLHAGAIVVDGAGLICLGPSGQGKSTLVGSFLRAGYDVLGDDVLEIDVDSSSVQARSRRPTLTLRPDSHAALFLNETGEEQAPAGKKRLGIPSERSGEAPWVPLCCGFVLEHAAECSGISLTRLSPREACMALVANTFALDPTDRQKAARRLSQASFVADKIPLYRLRYPRDFAQLPDVRAAILECFRDPSRDG